VPSASLNGIPVQQSVRQWSPTPPYLIDMTKREYLSKWFPWLFKPEYPVKPELKTGVFVIIKGGVYMNRIAIVIKRDDCVVICRFKNDTRDYFFGINRLKVIYNLKYAEWK
jgi:hypothetical protein